MKIEEIKEILNNWYKMFDGNLGEGVQEVYDHIDSTHNLLIEINTRIKHTINKPPNQNRDTLMLVKIEELLDNYFKNKEKK